MSPIGTALAAGSLAGLASRGAEKVAEAVSGGVSSFAEVLAGPAETDAPKAKMTLGEIEQKIAEKIRELLKVENLDPSHRFDVVVSESGKIWVSGTSEQRGQLESRINDSGELTSLLRQRAAAGRSSLGWPRFGIASERAKLTQGGSADNNLQRAGGYPNW